MLMKKKEGELAPRGGMRDPFALFRQMTADFDQLFADPFLRWPAVRSARWAIGDLLPRDRRVREGQPAGHEVDLPGMTRRM